MSKKHKKKQNKSTFPAYFKMSRKELFIIPVVMAIFIAIIMIISTGHINIWLISATLLGFYMAVNIGANDVANNMGPAVWAKAMTIVWAIIIAAICEASGAIIAGGDVVNTIKGWIINPELITDSSNFIAIMMSTLLWAALWINIATIVKAPVSATHSVIGWLIGAWVTGYGVWIVEWSKIGQIMASWIISPVMGWIIAALILLSIRKTIIEKKDKSEAAKTWLPVFIWLMSWTFSTYLLLKGLKKLIDLNFLTAFLIGFIIACIVYFASKRYIKEHKGMMKNSSKSINKMFNIPLVFSAALLSFAHGANDVANAIWPLAAINDILQNGGTISANASIPIWIMIIWAIGIAVWLAVFGSRLIKTVGSEITKLNQISAFSVGLAAAITVIIASQLGLPVSSTHIAIGWVFGVWISKEYRKHKAGKNKSYIEKGMIKSIALAWIITLPVSAGISSLVYLGISRIT